MRNLGRGVDLMPWFKVEGRVAFHPKMVSAGNMAIGVWVRMGAWAADNRTDGLVPLAIASAIGRSRDFAKLIEAGLLHDAGRDGFQLHDFLNYNPSRDDDEQLRAERARAGSIGARIRWASNGKHDGKCHGKSMPDPDPDLIHTSESTSSTSDKSAKSADIDSVWRHWLGWWSRVRGSGAAPTLNKRRRGQIRARLAEGYTAERLRAAADGCWTRSYNLEHGYLTPELVYRSGGQVELYEGFAAQTTVPLGEPTGPTIKEALAAAYAAEPDPAYDPS